MPVTFPDINAARAVAVKVQARGSIYQSLWAPLMPLPGTLAGLALQAAVRSDSVNRASLAA